MNDIEQILADYVRSQEKTWSGHDRLDTCGASEIFGCIRRLWYEKHEIPHDADYEDRYGARLRGNLIEDHFLVPAFRNHLSNGLKVVAMGHNQSTRANGYISATPDGIVINEGDTSHTFCDVGLAPGGSAVIEFKSIDPRANLDRPKPQHVGQVQVQIGLIRKTSNHKPDAAILVYVDASFLDDVTTFKVDYDPTVFETATKRAHVVFDTDDPKKLSSEGAISGGSECEYCPWFKRCRGDDVARVPREAQNLSEEDMELARDMAYVARELKEAENAAAQAYKEHLEKAKRFLETRDTRAVKGDGWGLTWATRKGRKTISKQLIEAAGLDPEDYTTEGQPGEQITVTAKQESRT